MTDTSTAPAKKPTPAAKKKAPAKKAAPKKAPPLRTAKYSDTAKIKLLVKENPCRAGSVSYEKFAKFRDGMTVGEFIKAGEKHPDWDMRGIIGTAIKRGQISVKE
jgi:hypothetical protein